MSFTAITTVLQQAKSYDLTTLTVVKDELGDRTGNNNAVLRRYIASASAAAAQYCNRKFQAETVRDEFFPERLRASLVLAGGTETLQLSRWPVVSVASVTENGNALAEDTDFRVDYDIGRLIRLDMDSYPSRWGTLPVVVEYVGGFETIPAEVEDAVIRMVTRRFLAKGRDPNLRQQNVPGVLEQSWWIATGVESGNMTPDITDLLDNYRVPVMA